MENFKERIKYRKKVYYLEFITQLKHKSDYLEERGYYRDKSANKILIKEIITYKNNGYRRHNYLLTPVKTERFI
jgi:hypothetical protein